MCIDFFSFTYDIQSVLYTREMGSSYTCDESGFVPTVCRSVAWRIRDEERFEERRIGEASICAPFGAL